jgi:hypothetical protein
MPACPTPPPPAQSGDQHMQQQQGSHTTRLPDAFPIHPNQAPDCSTLHLQQRPALHTTKWPAPAALPRTPPGLPQPARRRPPAQRCASSSRHLLCSTTPPPHTQLTCASLGPAHQNVCSNSPHHTPSHAQRQRSPTPAAAADISHCLPAPRPCHPTN